MIAALKRAPPDTGEQDQQSPADQRDKQEDVPAVQAEVVQPGPSSDMSGDGKTLSGSCASKNVEKAKDRCIALAAHTLPYLYYVYYIIMFIVSVQ